MDELDPLRRKYMHVVVPGSAKVWTLAELAELDIENKMPKDRTIKPKFRLKNAPLSSRAPAGTE
eukprot:9061785-Alexandrium_andersonii.AAC.1